MVVAFSACNQNTEDVISGNPSIELVDMEDDVISFDADGGECQVSLIANRKWTVKENVDWILVNPTSGDPSEEEQAVTIKVVKNEKDEDDPFAGFDREGIIQFTVGAKSVYITIKQAGPQGSTEDLIVYYNDFDKEKAQKGENGWATYLDSFEGWKNETGSGIETLTYVFDRITARTNSNNGSAGSYSIYEGSGMNYLWFGSGKPYLAVQDITIPEGKVNFKISFGAERYQSSDTEEVVDNTFNWNEFKAYVSVDGAKWTAFEFEFAGGELPDGKWDLASKTIKVPAGTEKLYLYFISSTESAYAIDDLKVEESLVEGVEVDFAAGEEFTPGEAEEGEESDATAIYNNNFDKLEAQKAYGSSGESFPYLDQFDGWQNAAGTGVEAVTYSYRGMSVRANSYSNGSFSDYEGSGLNNLFFGSDAYFLINNIKLDGATNLTLTFGTEKYSQDNGSVFTNSEFHIWLSNDGGAKWVEFTDYTFAGGTTEGRWNVATANFTVPAGSEALSICFQVDVASSYRMDDLKLVASDAEGTVVDFANAVEKDFAVVVPDTGEDSDATAIYSNNYDKQEATKTYGSSSNYFPYLDQFDGWQNAAGTGAANVTYVYNGMSARSNSTSNSSYSDYAGSGMNNLFFGANAYFATKNVALDGATDLTLTFGTEKYSQDNGSVFTNSEFHIWLSNDGGAKWVEFTDYTFAGGTKEGRWNVATANFTVPAGTETLSICMKVDVASSYRMDDFKLVAATTAGTAVDFSNATEQDFSSSNPSGGDSSDATAIYSNNFDKQEATKTYGSSGNSYPYLDQFDGWMNAAGTGAANVTYAYNGMSVRSNSTSDSNYSDYDGSGMNNIFFGKSAYFSTNNIALNGATNLSLTFGAEKYSQSGSSIFTNSEYHIWLSNDGGTKWVEFTDYTFAGGTTEGRWNVATANFTVPAGTETLSICMKVDAESVYRMDDFKLVASDAAGTAVDFSNAVEKDFSTTGGGTVTPPSGGGESDATAIYSNNYDKSAAVKTTEGYWPYFSDTEDCWQNAAGTGIANVTYASKNVTVRNNSNSDGSYSDYDGSGLNNIFFGKDNPFVSTNNIALGGATNLTLTFGAEKYSQTDGSVFTNSEFHIWLSNDGGAKWVEFTDYTFAGGTTEGRWNVATANFTVPAGTETLSICMQVDVASAYRLDDFRLVEAAAAGTAVDFSNAVAKDFSTEGGSTGGDDPVTPPAGGEGGAMTIAEVLAYNGALPTGTTIEGVVISNMELNNLTSKKGMYIQDETAALQFYLAANHEFAFGDKVQVDLSGVTKADYNGATQVSGLALDKITKISSGNTVQPKVVSMADFLANKYEGQYIALEGVQVAASDLSKKFVEGSSHTSINMEDASGNKFVVFSSKYASYGAVTVPQGSGTIKGISSISKGTMQLIFAQASDYADLTGARFDDAGDEEGGDEEGGEVVTPPAGDVTGTSLTISRETMTGISWTTNSYGSQNISNLSTYLSWNINGVGFIGAKMCIPQSSNVFSEFAIQCQGNTDAAKQARFGNTTSVGKIKKITVISHNEKYTPNFNLALGTEQVVGVAVPSSMIAAESMTTTKDGTTYTTVYEPTEDVGFFAIYKNTTGALYFSEVIVEYEVAE